MFHEFPVRKTLIKGFFILFIGLCSGKADAQYFGRNKVVYRDFNFREVRTEHFKIYNYLEDSVSLNDFVKMAERWHFRLSNFLNHRFKGEKPIIFYSSHADFQQTNVTQGMIDVGTGGFTESLKNRLVMPLANSYAATDHVIGHEMVHEFQFDIIDSLQNNRDSLKKKPRQLHGAPLWMIEGLAEYLSVGRVDAHTAMYLRDAMIHNKLPSLKNLSAKPDKYFPYRWGQAFWAYVGGKFGDDKVKDVFIAVLRNKWDTAFSVPLGVKPDSLGKMWKAQIIADYKPLIANRTLPKDAGQRVLAPDLYSGKMNLSPSVSPDGKYVAYLSEKNFLAIDLYVAEAQTGKIVRRLTSTGTKNHFDQLSFINSSGSWSPDGKRFVFVAFAKGKNVFLVFNMEKGKLEHQFSIEGVNALADPAWSPNGSTIAFSGMTEGVSDLYLLNVKTKKVLQLTHDRYADVQPTWRPDGKILTFVSDRGVETNFETYSFSKMQLVNYDIESRTVTPLNIFENGKHINPQYSADGKSIYFISDQDGFSDVYRYSLNPDDSVKVFRVTTLATGVSGITDLSSAMSIAHLDGKMMFSVFEDGRFVVYSKEASQIKGVPVDSLPTVNAGALPPIQITTKQDVVAYLNSPEGGLTTDLIKMNTKYKSRLSLDFIGQSAGASYSGFGAGFGGSIVAVYSDVLGNHRLGAAIIANQVQSYKDLGGQLSYQYLRHRIHYGGGFGHLPYANNLLFRSRDTTGAFYTGQYSERLYIDQGFITTAYPFSANKRLELSAGYTHYAYDLTLKIDYDDGPTETIPVQDPDPLSIYQTSLAYVADFSVFGFTGPIKGKRYRLEVTPSFGSLNYVTALADYRRYFFYRPVTIALRTMYAARYGEDAIHDRLRRFFLGYETVVRGYESYSFSNSECPDPENCPEYQRLFGSRLAVFNLELRHPFTGIEDYGLIKFPYLVSDLGVFFDGGLAWTDTEAPVLALSSTSNSRIPVFSAGVITRINFGNVLALNFYYVYPIQRPQKGWHFGFTIFPGW
jgi:Tol biopolymer transport system component